ncbi:tail sheath protein [Archangium gephyra]|uniref:Tail sheath protein n=1 Tax=Archangium gephyra TaxID=48 RepID=A0AAC8Q8K9_9BACT|nr:hypothetical protein [Archangium gephyra]AKJ02900.1 Phage tail sheath protein FI [Archangium gephyra]REG25026.1 tail sheath protein [Archangium gephyra]
MRRPDARRLPGIRFDVQAPSIPDELPRMDVAAFVGFASSGPLHRPVVVEDVARFQALFGEDLALATDAERKELVHARLAPAVRDFFRNGGRRCWVVRVAGAEARSNLFPLPGLLRRSASGQLSPAFARARSEGSWSDSLQLATTLSARPLSLAAWSAPAGDGPVELTVIAPAGLSPGELIRVRFAASGHSLLLPVESVKAIVPGQGATSSGLVEHQTWVRAQGRRPLWLRSAAVEQAPWVARWMRGDTERLLNVREVSALGLELETDFADAPRPGSLLRLESHTASLWFTVGESFPLEGRETPTVRVRGEAVQVLPGTPDVAELPPGTSGTCELLTLGLWIRSGVEQPLRLEELGLCPEHPRYWGALPTDAEWVRITEGQLPTGERLEAEERLDPTDTLQLHASLREETLEPRFPLAGQQDDDPACYLPLGVGPLPERFLGCVPSPLDALERDGLAEFHSRLFLDEALRGIGIRALPGHADFLRYQSSRPRELKGLHALLSKADVSLVAIPDAAHRPWKRVEQEPAASPKPPEPAKEPGWGTFLDCGTRVLPPPSRPVATPPSPAADTIFTLTWTTPTGPGATHVLEEATRADYLGARTLYQGPTGELTLHGRDAGTYYYRVRSELGGLVSAYSPGLAVSVSTGPRWELSPEEDYSASHLLAIQRALLRMCAARGDLLAVLSLPEHYREEKAIAHAAALRAPLAPEEEGVPPLGTAEENALSHGALYHPWLLATEEGAPQRSRRSPPDGAACGVISRRTLERGAWLAPANEPWRGVVALAPALSRERWVDLQEARVNLLLQEARGFLTLSESTLAVDPELLPIHVRRLLALLRRAALQLGTTYVFEPNDASFRRLVQRGFEGLLGGLFTRGAFAGQDPEQAFQVVTGTSLNTPASADQGRFFVELKVAPSSPLAFLNVRLVQTGELGLVTEER